MLATASCPKSDFSVPKCSDSWACTTRPRVPLGSSVSFSVPGICAGWLRASRLAGVGSKASATAAAGSPL